MLNHINKFGFLAVLTKHVCCPKWENHKTESNAVDNKIARVMTEFKSRKLRNSFLKNRLLFWKQLKGSVRKKGNFRLLLFFVSKFMNSWFRPNLHFAEISKLKKRTDVGVVKDQRWWFSNRLVLRLSEEACYNLVKINNRS